MPHLSPTTLTADEQRLILRATAGHLRDHLISLALGTGLRLGEIVALDIGDVYGPGGVVKIRTWACRTATSTLLLRPLKGRKTAGGRRCCGCRGSDSLARVPREALAGVEPALTSQLTAKPGK